MSWSEIVPDVLSIATFLNVTRVKQAFHIIDHQRESEAARAGERLETRPNASVTVCSY